MSTTTRIEVLRSGDRTTCRLSGTQLSARRIQTLGDRVRVALVATMALLLAGDAVRIEVIVGEGVHLEIVEIAGTVAYDMRGGAASWEVDIQVAPGARLFWSSLPFVVATGADVIRSTSVRISGQAQVALREILVFGRTGELGGELISSNCMSVDGRPAVVESLDLRATSRADLGVLDGRRCLDTVTTIGRRLERVGTHTMQLEACGSIERRLVDALHESDLHTRMREVATTFWNYES